MKPAELQCTVTSFKMLTPTVFETAFTTNIPLEFIPGQFISIVIPGAGPKGRDLRRAYSIASTPEMTPVELCIKLVEDGPGTNYLYKLRPGDVFRGFAPYGDFTFKPRPGRGACFISTGTGIAPFRSMILSDQYKIQPPTHAVCLLGVRHEEELLYSNAFVNHKEVEFVQAVSQPGPNWNGFKGRVTDYLRLQGDSFKWLETDYYLCGNGSMITETKALLADKGVPKEAIHQEIYYR